MFSASKTAAPVSGSFQVSNSLRFRQSASAYLSKTLTLSATWTLSLWIKRGKLGVTSPIFGSSIAFNSNDTLTAGTLTTTAVYRDPSSWYHIVVSNSGCYVNGVSVGSVTTGILVNPSIGNYLTNYFDGYMAEVNFIDGQALTPSSFGSINATTGVWQPARYTGSYGTNGFYLKFSNGTSTTTLGNDSSGNGNNWTTNNISLTAGSTYDWMIDSPTSYAGSSYGVGNYAVLNPLDLVSPSTLSAGNLNFDTGIAGGGGVNANWQFPLTGKFYFELYNLGNVAAANGRVLCANIYWEGNTGDLYVSGSFVANIGTYTSGDTLAWATDCAAQTIKIYKNNALLYTASVGSAMYLSTVFSFRDGSGSNGITGSVNFGQMPFIYTPPTGFKSLCTQNLPAPTIYNGANHMAATLWTGNGGSPRPISNVGFAPDLVWIKSRSAAYDALIFDTVRSAGKSLTPSSTSSEITNNGNGYLSAFGTDGFTLTQGSSSIVSVNENGTTYVGWQWKANGTAVSNTTGTITSSVSANTTAGFSVVTYTGTGANATVGHGLGVAPSMVIVKKRSATSAWVIGFTFSGFNWASDYFQFDTGAKRTDGAGTVFTTSPSSTVFSLGTDGGVNGSTATCVAYCFAAIAGYSAFGSYTGNGSADGPFVYCGFRPRYVLVKCSSNASYGYWDVIDTARDPYNAAFHELFPNDSTAEYTGGRYTDILSNGFKQRTSAYANVNGETYIYAAFCESPFQNSLAR